MSSAEHFTLSANVNLHTNWNKLAFHTHSSYHDVKDAFQIDPSRDMHCFLRSFWLSVKEMYSHKLLWIVIQPSIIFVQESISNILAAIFSFQWAVVGGIPAVISLVLQ